VLSTIEADLISLLLKCERTGQVIVPTTKQNLIEKIENRAQNAHRGPLSMSW
jgi:hypothetical protein